MTNAKTGLKIVTATLIFIGLVILSGLWRLKESPLRLPVHFDVVRSMVKHFGMDFQEIYLFTPSLISLPGVLIEKGHFENDRIQFTADQILIHWKFKDLFFGKTHWEIDTVLLETPTLTFKPHSENFDNGNYLDLPISSLTFKNGCIKNLPNGALLSPHTINGNFYQQGLQKTFHFYGHTFTHEDKSFCKGNLSINGAIIKGSINFSNLVLKEWTSLAPKTLESWLSFFSHPFPEITLNLQGNWIEQTGEIHAKIQAPFIDKGTRYSVPMTVTIQGTKNSGAHQIDLLAKTDSFSWTALQDLWPPFLSPASHFWCTKRIQGGNALPIIAKSQFLYDPKTQNLSLNLLEGTLGVENATVTYMDHMPVVENAKAEAIFSAQDFTIHIKDGTTKDIKVNPKSVVRFYDLMTESPQGLVDIYLDGPLSDALWIADHPPLAFASQYGFDPKAIRGESHSHLVLKFPTFITPTLKTMDTIFDANVSDFAFKLPLLGHTLQFDKGDLQLHITPKKLSVRGKSLLNGTPSTIFWEENMAKKAPFVKRYRIKTSLSLEEILRFTPRSFEDAFQSQKEFSVKGRPALYLDYKEFSSEKSHLALMFNLQNSFLELPILGYKKNQRKLGTLALSLSFDKGNIKAIDALKVKAPHLSLSSTAVFNKNGTLHHVDFKEILVNKTNIKGSLHQKGNTWILDLKGPSLELPPIIDFYKNLPDSPKDSSTPFILKGDFSKIILQKEIELPPLQARMEWTKEGLSSYGFIIKDKEDDLFSLHYGPQKALETISFRTTLLDQFLKGLNITETISSGLMSFTLERPLDKKADPFKGALHAENLRVKDASLLAKVLSLLSIEGILSTLTGDGILFVRGDADFEYLNKKIAVQHLELTSSSLGLTGKGYIDFGDDTIDAEGYVIPANILNQLIGNIPFLGQLLSGNSKEHKGLVSMSYSMKGTLKDPVISSNPLSALAPNFVKGIFSHLTGASNNTPTLNAKEAL